MIVQNITVGPIQENTYVYWDENSLEGVLIDPGDDANKIVSFVEQHKIQIKAILLTHGHYDHFGACEELNNQLGAPVYAGRNEQDLLEHADLNCSQPVFGRQVIYSHANYFEEGDLYHVGSSSLKVIFTPGHTKGGVCYYDEDQKLLFSGDTLFYESIGRTDFPTGNYDTLENSIITKLFTLPDDVTVYPGHMQKTTIGHERKNNPYLK